MKNHSPWLHELRRERDARKLDKDIQTDIVVVGAGIAGIATTFFLLTETDKKVVLVDRYMLAHGATGHNAGQLTSYFERPFSDLVKEFGLEDAGKAQKAVESAWELLDHIYTTSGLNIPLARFTGHLGLCTEDQIKLHLKNNRLRKDFGLQIEETRISNDLTFLADLKEYEDLFTLVPHEEILDILQTENSDYIAVFSYQKGTTNSALLSEGVYTYLAKQYPNRFSLYEHTDIRKVVLSKFGAVLDACEHVLTADKLILCTNGFEHVQIINDGGLELDTKFHHEVEGVVGYMSAYLEKMNKPPFAGSYFTKEQDGGEDVYFYLTRRQYDFDGKGNHNLISVGGPETVLDDRKKYIRDYEYPEEEKEKIDEFVKSTYDTDPNKMIDYQFTWHGLMGYTPNRVRLIGEEPSNPVLLYNLGCNGIGILPAIFGAKRIADIISGKLVEPMIFDPKNQK